jgi:hypothetical protein
LDHIFEIQRGPILEVPQGSEDSPQMKDAKVEPFFVKNREFT